MSKEIDKVKTHQLTTVIVKQPERLLADCNNVSRTPIILFASDMSEAGSRTGWPPTTQEILKARPLPVWDSQRTPQKQK